MNPNLPYPSARQPVLARNLVATSQPLAAQAGAAAFARGGNAIDAALAAAITLTVVEPTMNGIGGDAFALVHDGVKLHGLTASGRSPAGWTPARFAGLPAMPRVGWESVTVPGVVSAWVALSERFGALPFEDLFSDALRHARDGFPVSPVIARQWESARTELGGQPGFDAFLLAGRAPRVGELWSFADQATTLEDIARTRGESFYRGRLAQRIAAHAAEHGAALNEADLAAHRCDWVEPIGIDFRGHTVWEIPPSGQGIGALIALGLLDQLDYDATAPGSAARMHLEIEAMRLAFADLAAHVSDPATMRIDPARLLEPAYLRERARLIDPARAGQYPAGQPHSGGTVYLCTADAQGRMVSFIQSNFKGFGSGVVVPGTGIALHNRGTGFVTTPGHPNEVGPAKRPFHTIIPAFMTQGQRPVMAFGVMGGNMQPQGHAQVVLRHLLEGHNPQAACDAPRWRIADDEALTLEASVPSEVVQGLRERGHQPQVAAPDSLAFGSAQVVLRLPAEAGGPDLPRYAGGSDPRRDGQVVGC